MTSNHGFGLSYIVDKDLFTRRDMLDGEDVICVVVVLVAVGDFGIGHAGVVDEGDLQEQTAFSFATKGVRFVDSECL